MQNLGYFQLKANPGVWRLSLAEGRAAALYTILDTGDSDSDGGLVWFNMRRQVSDAHPVDSRQVRPLRLVCGALKKALTPRFVGRAWHGAPTV